MNNKIWNGNGYDSFGNFSFNIKDGKGNVKEYDSDGKLIFEGLYIKGERVEGILKEYDSHDSLIFKWEKKRKSKRILQWKIRV